MPSKVYNDLDRYKIKYWNIVSHDNTLPKVLKLNFIPDDELCPNCKLILDFNYQVIGIDYFNNKVIISDDYHCDSCNENFFIELEFNKYIDKHGLEL